MWILRHLLDTPVRVLSSGGRTSLEFRERLGWEINLKVISIGMWYEYEFTYECKGEVRLVREWVKMRRRGQRMESRDRTRWRGWGTKENPAEAEEEQLRRKEESRRRGQVSLEADCYPVDRVRRSLVTMSSASVMGFEGVESGLRMEKREWEMRSGR